MPSRPIRFLHVADIHLGCNQYGSVERERDFFYAFESAVSRFAMPLKQGQPPQVDFVLIAGDLFDKQQIQPTTLSHASAVLADLKEAGIPVFAIEGNHDTFRKDEKQNWYQYLCGEQMLFFLRDEIHEGEVSLEAWDGEELRGGYCDLGDVRIIGTRWYGSTAQAMVEKLCRELAKLERKPFQILMFHGGLADHISGASAGVEYETFLPLREYVDYLALGHVHKEYNRQGWLFNPGGLEASKADEFREIHGAYVITWDPETREIASEHRQDYMKRPVVQCDIEASAWRTVEEAKEALSSVVPTGVKRRLEEIKERWPREIEMKDAVCHLHLRGSLAFPFSEIPCDALKERFLEELPLFLLRWHNDTTPLEMILHDFDPADSIGERRSRLERRLFVELLKQEAAYAPQAEAFASFAVDLKRSILADELEESLEQKEALFRSLRSLVQATPEESPSLDSLSDTKAAAILSSPSEETAPSLFGLLQPSSEESSPKGRKKRSKNVAAEEALPSAPLLSPLEAVHLSDTAETKKSRPSRSKKAG